MWAPSSRGRRPGRRQGNVLDGLWARSRFLPRSPAGSCLPARPARRAPVRSRCPLILPCQQPPPGAAMAGVANLPPGASEVRDDASGDRRGEQAGRPRLCRAGVPDRAGAPGHRRPCFAPVGPVVPRPGYPRSITRGVYLAIRAAGVSGRGDERGGRAAARRRRTARGAVNRQGTWWSPR